MNKYYNGLLVAASLCSAARGLIASEKPFFDEPTQQVTKKTAKYYGYTYAGLWGVGNVGNVALTTLFSPLAVLASCIAKDERLLGEALSPWSTIKKGNRELCKVLLKSTMVTAPVVFGSTIAYHKYQADCRQENDMRINE